MLYTRSRGNEDFVELELLIKNTDMHQRIAVEMEITSSSEAFPEQMVSVKWNIDEIDFTLIRVRLPSCFEPKFTILEQQAVIWIGDEVN